MLLWLLKTLANAPSGRLAALEKITFRASLAAVAAFFLALLLGPRLIAWLRPRFGEQIRSDSAALCKLHEHKQSTPTMGGLFLVAGLVAGVLVFGELGNRFLQIALLLVVGLAAVGAVDDLAKLRGNGNGLAAAPKLLGQLVVAIVVAVLLYQHQATVPGGLTLPIPLLGRTLYLGVALVPLAVLVIVGMSNAVNLTDGLDGLAGGCLVFATGAMTLVAYACGHAELAQYLHLPRVPGAGELAVLAGGMMGAMLGFLWFNCHPAQVFMGDTGSLSLGGLLGLLAVVTRQEFLLLLVGGVFVAEAASVIIQVAYFKWRGRRVFLCAPLHHHFQFLGWPESRIVVRFWIAAALCALLGMACLKVNIHDDAHATPTPSVAARTQSLQ